MKLPAVLVFNFSKSIESVKKITYVFFNICFLSVQMDLYGYGIICFDIGVKAKKKISRRNSKLLLAFFQRLELQLLRHLLNIMTQYLYRRHIKHRLHQLRRIFT